MIFMLHTIEIIGVIVALFSVAMSIFLVWIQSRDAFFSEYTHRFQELWLDCQTLPKDADERHILLYLDLCSEEWHLYNRCRIPGRVWRNWMVGMRSLMRNESYIECWKRNKNGFDVGFQLYFEKEVIHYGDN